MQILILASTSQVLRHTACMQINKCSLPLLYIIVFLSQVECCTIQLKLKVATIDLGGYPMTIDISIKFVVFTCPGDNIDGLMKTF